MANILLAENRPNAARALAELFTAHGHTVTIAPTGYQVMRLWSRYRYALLFSDYQLDRITITTVLAQLQKDGCSPMRVIVRSTNFNSAAAIESYRRQLRAYLPAEAYLLLVPKGAEGEDLLDMIQNALEA